MRSPTEEKCSLTSPKAEVARAAALDASEAAAEARASGRRSMSTIASSSGPLTMASIGLIEGAARARGRERRKAVVRRTMVRTGGSDEGSWKGGFVVVVV